MKQIKVLLFLTLISGYLLSSCNESIVSECKTDNQVEMPMKASFAEIQEKVLTPTCATSSCHGGIFSPNLEAGKAFANMVGVQSQGSSLKYVEPGQSENSYLIKKLNGDGTSPMPSGSPKLDKAIIDSIAAWIDNGALNN